MDRNEAYRAAAEKGVIMLTEEEELKLLAPIDEHVGRIQRKIDELRTDGTDRVTALKTHMAVVKHNACYSEAEKARLLAEDKKSLGEAKAKEAENRGRVQSLVSEAVRYLDGHYDKDYLDRIASSCAAQARIENKCYAVEVAALKKQHLATLASMTDPAMKKEENYLHNNRMYDAELAHKAEIQAIRNRRHEAFMHRYHLIDLLRLSRFTFMEKEKMDWENYRFTFSGKRFFLANGLYIAILVLFAILCVVAPVVSRTSLLTIPNILNILEIASPRIFLALGVGGLILLGGTDLSVGRMVGAGMILSTMLMHKGPNTGTFFGVMFDFTGIPVWLRVILALLASCAFTTGFSVFSAFFTAKYKIHPFITSLATMLIIYGFMSFATKGVSFGGIESSIPEAIIPVIGGFPTIILWAAGAVFVVCFIWNKTALGKSMFAVGGNKEAAAVSGISVFRVMISAAVIAGILYGFGAWMECVRMMGSGSASYGQGWEAEAIAACVVGGISFSGGVGKIRGIVVGVLIFTAVTYALTVLGVDTNLQFIFSGIIIIAAVTIDCFKHKLR